MLALQSVGGGVSVILFKLCPLSCFSKVLQIRVPLWSVKRLSGVGVHGPALLSIGPAKAEGVRWGGVLCTSALFGFHHMHREHPESREHFRTKAVI